MPDTVTMEEARADLRSLSDKLSTHTAGLILIGLIGLIVSSAFVMYTSSVSRAQMRDYMMLQEVRINNLERKVDLMSAMCKIPTSKTEQTEGS